MEHNFQTYITGLQHIGIPTNDMEATVAFYETLGFEIAYETVIEAVGERVVFFRLGDTMVEAYENKQAALRNGAVDHFALNVTDIEAVFRLAKEKGLCILDEGIQSLSFWENGVRFFSVAGPNKEKVEFNQYL